MDKPNWSEAPEFAKWLAQDSPVEGSAWTWFESQPTPDSTGAWIQAWNTKFSHVIVGTQNNEWINTLEQRP